MFPNQFILCENVKPKLVFPVGLGLSNHIPVHQNKMHWADKKILINLS